jgi:hypothetical protein
VKRLLHLLACLASVAMVFFACSADQTKLGGLMLILATDGTPLDTLKVQINSGNNPAPLMADEFRLDETKLPNTISIVSNGNATSTATIVVSGWKDGVPVDRRDAIVRQIPVDRVVSLRVTLSAKCKSKVKLDEATNSAVSLCAEGKTCDPTAAPEAECVAADVDGNALPEYTPGQEFEDGGIVVPVKPASFCTPRTCAEQGFGCGAAGNGCGAAIECGACNVEGQTCGGGGTPSQCGAPRPCVRKTCADYPADNCGPLSDGCGGLLLCGDGGASARTCAFPQTCGGAGVPSVCGGTGACIPKTKAAVCLGTTGARGSTCGPVANGCGGSIDCGDCTNVADGCGADPSKPGVCAAKSSADAAACKKKTCTDLGFGCGPAGDGCGGLLDCGSCESPQTCGGGGQPSQCGGTGACIPKTCADYPSNSCGPVPDGCGKSLTCGANGGACVSPAICGGLKAGECGANTCQPKRRTDFGPTCCGLVADGCGGLIDCGKCANAGDICGLSVPNICSAPPCDGLCAQKPTNCPGGTNTTRLVGTVYAPNGTTPIYGAFVYVPTSTVAPLTDGIECSTCGAVASGNPLVQAMTGTNGTFVLNDMPAGNAIPVVIQLGKWRKQITVNTTACQQTPLSAAAGSLPSRHQPPNNEIPRIAISTGTDDPIECLLLKAGINIDQFGPGSASDTTKRIHMYQGDPRSAGTNDKGGRPPQPNTTAVPESTLFAGTTINRYDNVFLDCEGAATGTVTKTAAQVNTLANYLNSGGRAFLSHFEYVWLTPQAPMNQTANWVASPANPMPTTPLTTNVDRSFAAGAAMAAQLGNTFSINQARKNFSTLPASSQRWLYTTGNPNPDDNGIQLYSFRMPVQAQPAAQCGQAFYNDFHVMGLPAAQAVQNEIFPDYCPSTSPGTLTPQEKAFLAIELFNTPTCILPVTPPTCTAKTCADYAPGTCGRQQDGCGGMTADCTPCPVGQTCGGGGVPNRCGGPSCTPLNCAQQGIQCGPAGDGCGGPLNCGNCSPPLTCGVGGTPGKCGTTCSVSRTCASQGFDCGPAGDGCGNKLDCGTCPKPGDTCGGGGSPGVCGNSPCVPKSCAAMGASCGPASNGCGGLQDCGSCPADQACGGGGASKCGPGPCTPRTCQSAGATCGSIGNGCGGQLNCGVCSDGTVCGGNETPNVCAGCKPRTCAEQGIACGPAGDGCGKSIQCGSCPAPRTCGGGGEPFKCGAP